MSDKRMKSAPAKGPAAKKPVAPKPAPVAAKTMTAPAAVAAATVEPAVKISPAKAPVIAKTAPVETSAKAAPAETPVAVKPAPVAVETPPVEKPALVKAEPTETPAAAEIKPVETPAPAKTAPVETPVVAKTPPVKTPAPEKTVPVETPAIAKTAPAETPAQPIVKGPSMTETLNATAETAKSFAQDAQARATQFFGDVNARTKAAVERSQKLAEELADFNKGNLEAFVESGRVAAKAAETLGQQAAETARKNFETTTAALKTFASAKTPTEFFQLQSDYARTTFDTLIAETSKNSETFLKLAGDVFQPLSNRFAVAADKFKAAA